MFCAGPPGGVYGVGATGGITYMRTIHHRLQYELHDHARFPGVIPGSRNIQRPGIQVMKRTSLSVSPLYGGVIKSLGAGSYFLSTDIDLEKVRNPSLPW